MKMRKDVPIGEVLAVIDSRLAVVRDKRAFLRSYRDPAMAPARRKQKYADLRYDRAVLLSIRRSLSFLRYVRDGS